MFNLNKRNTTNNKNIRVKKHKYFSYKIFIGILFFAISIVPSNAIFAYWWLDTTIQSALDSLRPQDTIKALYWDTNLLGKVNVNIFKNMYSKAYRLASIQEEATEIQTVASLRVEIMNRYKCEITEKEAGKMFKNGGKSVTAWDCLPLIRCRDRDKKKNNVSISELNTCKSLLTSKYARSYKAIYDSATLINTTMGTDIYANGSIDDGWYDILYDIQKIGDVLFKENDQTAETLFFSFPNGSIAWLQAIQFGENTTSTSLPNSITLTKDENTTDTENRDDSESTRGAGRTDWDGVSKGSDDGTENAWDSTKKGTPELNEWSNTNISNYVCLPQNDEKTEIADEKIDNSEGKPWDLDNNKDPIDNTWRGIRNTVNINEPPTNKPTEKQSSVVDNANWDDSTSMQDNEEQVKACIKKCTDSKWSFSDKVFCIAKCSCTTQRTNNWIAWISICMIPTSQTDVLSKKPIQSVQEVIKEINNVLIALKNSWELIKHNKPTEFLDTSLARIQFNKIFAFDVNLSMKPLFSVPEKKEDKAKNDTESDRMANWSYPDIDVWKEKNKYAFYWNNGLTGSRTQDAELANELEKSLNTIQESQSQALIKTQNAQIIDSVRAFILDNIVYWDSVAETISSIQKTSDQLKQKILKK